MSAKIIKFEPKNLDNQELQTLEEPKEINVDFIDHSSTDYLIGYQNGFDDGYNYAILKMSGSIDKA